MANSAQSPHKGGKKNRKFGRNTAKCKRYRDKGQREKNKERRAAKAARRSAVSNAAERERSEKAAKGAAEDLQGAS